MTTLREQIATTALTVTKFRDLLKQILNPMQQLPRSLPPAMQLRLAKNRGF